MIPVGETELEIRRRRRSNRPGNSQAAGPQEDVTLERDGICCLTEGES